VDNTDRPLFNRTFEVEWLKRPAGILGHGDCIQEGDSEPLH
jgi:hypothetical protein